MDDSLYQYLIELMPDLKVTCSGCGVERQSKQAVIRDGRFYCSDECADRSLAKLIRPDPKGVKLGAFDI